MNRTPTTLIWLITACTPLLLGGASSIPPARPTAPVPPPYTATLSTGPITVDGVLDEAVWQTATAFPMSLSLDTQPSVQEGGEVLLAYDAEYLYLGARLNDSDVMQESDKDQDVHFKSGDVLELFLKPDDAPYYWELYVTPNGKKTLCFLEGGGRRFLPSSFEQDPSPLKAGATVQGTFNNPSDRDTGWTAELAVPLSLLSEKGSPLSPETPWTVLVGRYNYSVHLPNRELSMSPPQPVTNFHAPEHWAPLKLISN